MNSKKFLLLTLAGLAISSCKEEQGFPTDKKYWDVKDYEMVVNEIKYNAKPEEKLPTFDDPETRLLVEKLTDEENFKVVLDDTQLGVKHRSEMAQQFFDEWRKMSDLYSEMDRTDKYIYEKEFLEVWNFGLELQIRYFKLGNDAIIEKSDDPKSESVINVTNSNISTLVGNMMIYLDEINNEKSYSEEGLNLISKGIDTNFIELVNVYPDFDYSSLLRKVDLMLNKTKSVNIKQSLTKLKTLIELKANKAVV